MPWSDPATFVLSGLFLVPFLVFYRANIADKKTMFSFFTGILMSVIVSLCAFQQFRESGLLTIWREEKDFMDFYLSLEKNENIKNLSRIRKPKGCYIGTGEDPQWYLADRLGSVRQIVGASGAVLDEITYDSFGGILSETNPAQGDRFKFTCREYSPELGIYYYRARWYDPGSGRFISQDPIGFSAGDVNLYRYVGNGPGDSTDPEGKWSFYKWLYTGNGNIHDDIYDKAMTEGGEYLFQHSPFRGGFLLGGVEIKNPSISNKVYGEAVC